MSRKNRGKPAYQAEESISKFIPKLVTPKTKNQDKLLKSIERNLITFALGEAGTGKSYISVGAAIEHIYNGHVKEIILTRPIIEVGNHTLGYLPGGPSEKLLPYVSPLFDVVDEFWPKSKISELNIRTIPLNFMRGMTFRNAFVILDEASNCTREELKMFLTRFGEGSKIVINGDPSQSDLPERLQGGLIEYSEKLKDLNLIETVILEKQDIIRHSLVGDILRRLV